MKKFTFTLEPLYKFRKSTEKKVQLEYAQARLNLDRLVAEKDAIVREWDKTALECRSEMIRGVSVDVIAIYSNYFTYLKAEQEAVEKRIVRATAVVERKQAELVALMRELKTLDNLRDEQYRNYQAEVTKEEEAELNDILSYKTAMPEEEF